MECAGVKATTGPSSTTAAITNHLSAVGGRVSVLEHQAERALCTSEHILAMDGDRKLG